MSPATDDSACNTFLSGCVKSAITGGCMTKDSTTCSSLKGLIATCKAQSSGFSTSVVTDTVVNG